MTARLAVHSKKGSAMAERGNPPVELQRQLIRRQETKAIATYQTFIRNAETARPYPPQLPQGGWVEWGEAEEEASSVQCLSKQSDE